MADLHVRIPQQTKERIEELSGGNTPEFVRTALREAVERREEQTTLVELRNELAEVKARLARLESP